MKVLLLSYRMSKSTNNSRQLLPLSKEEMDELDNFLMSDITSDETMALDTLDGYLTAMVSGPVTLKLDEWLTWYMGTDKR